MSKQRRYREKTSELISALEQIIPGQKPLPPLTGGPGEEGEDGAKKRSRNQILLSCIEAIKKITSQDKDPMLKSESGEKRLRYSEILSNPSINVGVAVLRTDGTCISVNPALTTLLPSFKSNQMSTQIISVCNTVWQPTEFGHHICEVEPEQVIVSTANSAPNRRPLPTPMDSVRVVIVSKGFAKRRAQFGLGGQAQCSPQFAGQGHGMFGAGPGHPAMHTGGPGPHRPQSGPPQSGGLNNGFQGVEGQPQTVYPGFGMLGQQPACNGQEAAVAQANANYMMQQAAAAGMQHGGFLPGFHQQAQAQAVANLMASASQSNLIAMNPVLAASLSTQNMMAASASASNLMPGMQMGMGQFAGPNLMASGSQGAMFVPTATPNIMASASQQLLQNVLMQQQQQHAHTQAQGGGGPGIRSSGSHTFADPAELFGGGGPASQQAGVALLQQMQQANGGHAADSAGSDQMALQKHLQSHGPDLVQPVPVPPGAALMNALSNSNLFKNPAADAGTADQKQAQADAFIQQMCDAASLQQQQQQQQQQQGGGGEDGTPGVKVEMVKHEGGQDGAGSAVGAQAEPQPRGPGSLGSWIVDPAGAPRSMFGSVNMGSAIFGMGSFEALPDPTPPATTS